MAPISKPPPGRSDEERSTEENAQREEQDARAEADAQSVAQVEDQEGPRLGDLGSLEE